VIIIGQCGQVNRIFNAAVELEKLWLQNKLVVTTTSPPKDAKRTTQVIYTIAFFEQLNNNFYCVLRASPKQYKTKAPGVSLPCML